jgi:hypothetical protein
VTFVYTVASSAFSAERGSGAGRFIARLTANEPERCNCCVDGTGDWPVLLGYTSSRIGGKLRPNKQQQRASYEQQMR